MRERGEREAAVLARIQFGVWRVEGDGRGATWEPDIFGVAALSAPISPVEVSLKERNAKDPTVGGFHEVWKTVVDPKRQICRPVAAAIAGRVD